MSATVLYMSMSLDGFVAGPNESVENGLGDGGERLHEWIFAGDPTEHGGVPGRPPGVNGEVMDEAMATGAVVAGRGTFEPAKGWGGNHHDGVPIFILSRSKAGTEVPEWPLVTYVPEIETAMARAKEAAGDQDVLVHGASVAQLALAAGVLDEIQIHLVPVLLGEGRRLFEHLGADHVELESLRVREGAGVTHLRYRVCRAED
ncbi:MAG TPA: dihydrofolate reductase family protein [Solirubrobacterales bacterium]|nr:dihydrofolate reductase family protein [Solirubrobacterales bacterium]